MLELIIFSIVAYIVGIPLAYGRAYAAFEDRDWAFGWMFSSWFGFIVGLSTYGSEKYLLRFTDIQNSNQIDYGKTISNTTRKLGKSLLTFLSIIMWFVPLIAFFYFFGGTEPNSTLVILCILSTCSLVTGICDVIFYICEPKSYRKPLINYILAEFPPYIVGKVKENIVMKEVQTNNVVVENAGTSHEVSFTEVKQLSQGDTPIGYKTYGWSKEKSEELEELNKQTKYPRYDDEGDLVF